MLHFYQEQVASIHLPPEQLHLFQTKLAAALRLDLLSSRRLIPVLMSRCIARAASISASLHNITLSHVSHVRLFCCAAVARYNISLRHFQADQESRIDESYIGTHGHFLSNENVFERSCVAQCHLFT